MPIRINELHVRVNINEDQKSDERPRPQDMKKKDTLLIQTCVEEVLAILERREKR